MVQNLVPGIVTGTKRDCTYTTLTVVQWIHYTTPQLQSYTFTLTHTPQTHSQTFRLLSTGIFFFGEIVFFGEKCVPNYTMEGMCNLFTVSVKSIENPKIWESIYLIIFTESPRVTELFSMRVTGPCDFFSPPFFVEESWRKRKGGRRNVQNDAQVVAEGVTPPSVYK